MRIIKPLAITLAASLAVWGCSPETPTANHNETYPGELSAAEYNKLTDEQKYQVSNKLLGTMFRGMPVDEFFDISNGMDNLSLKGGANLLGDTKRALSSDLTEEDRNYYDKVITDIDDEDNNSLFEIDFNVNDDDFEWPKQLPLARMYAYPLSKDTFDNWIAYVLTNTILFSPAEEIDSTTSRDVQKVFDKLREDLRQNKTIREIIARHQLSQENWRRFRSPEDNTREMIEIYLGLFDRDADVPKASKACQNLYLTDDDGGYELISNGFINTEPQYVLDTYVTTCKDFYDVVASHPLVIPRVTTVLVEYFFYERSGEERGQIVNRIVSANPTTFQQIFKSILFSREYLINNERPRSSEESFFSTAHQMDWKPYRNSLNEMTDDLGTLSFKQMGWPVMSLKLGRFTGVPLDALSFANYHRGVREKLMLGRTGDGGCSSETNTSSDTRCRWTNGLGLTVRSEPAEPAADATEQAMVMYQYEVDRLAKLTERNERVMNLGVRDYINYLFLTSLRRTASETEMTELLDLCMNVENFIDQDVDSGELSIRNDRHDEIAQVVFDYASRLPEFYYFKVIN